MRNLLADPLDDEELAMARLNHGRMVKETQTHVIPRSTRGAAGWLLSLPAVLIVIRLVVKFAVVK